jgi:hypothetical protein
MSEIGERWGVPLGSGPRWGGGNLPFNTILVSR